MSTLQQPDMVSVVPWSVVPAAELFNLQQRAEYFSQHRHGRGLRSTADQMHAMRQLFNPGGGAVSAVRVDSCSSSK